MLNAIKEALLQSTAMPLDDVVAYHRKRMNQTPNKHWKAQHLIFAERITRIGYGEVTDNGNDEAQLLAYHRDCARSILQC